LPEPATFRSVRCSNIPAATRAGGDRFVFNVGSQTPGTIGSPACRKDLYSHSDLAPSEVSRVLVFTPRSAYSNGFHLRRNNHLHPCIYAATVIPQQALRCTRARGHCFWIIHLQYVCYRIHKYNYSDDGNHTTNKRIACDRIQLHVVAPQRCNSEDTCRRLVSKGYSTVPQHNSRRPR